MANLPFLPRCPTCDQLVSAPSNAKFLPFCSERCRLIDLGRWLKEEHVLPVQRDEDEDAEVEPDNKPKLPPGWHDP